MPGPFCLWGLGTRPRRCAAFEKGGIKKIDDAAFKFLRQRTIEIRMANAMLQP